MKIACFDVGGTGVKFAGLDQKGQVLLRKDQPTPSSLDGLLDFMDACLSEDTFDGIAMSVPGAVNPESYVIGGYSAVPYIHGFSWKEKLAVYGLPVVLENDANCVGLSQLLAEPDLQHLACVVVGTGIGGAMIVDGKLHRGPHALGGEFGYMLLDRPGEKLGNWSQLASTGSMVRYVKKATGQEDWNGKKIYDEAAKGHPVCVKAIERMNDYMAYGLLNIQYLFDPEVICIGGSISENEAFLKGVQKRVAELVDRYEEYSIKPVIKPVAYKGDANLYGALVCWNQVYGGVS